MCFLRMRSVLSEHQRQTASRAPSAYLAASGLKALQIASQRAPVAVPRGANASQPGSSLRARGYQLLEHARHSVFVVRRRVQLCCREDFGMGVRDCDCVACPLQHR
jgi:hypothetical protein